MEQHRDGGYVLHCTCGGPECNAELIVETFPDQDVVRFAFGDDLDHPFRLSELRKIVASDG